MRNLTFIIVAFFVSPVWVCAQDANNLIYEPDSNRIFTFQKTVDRYFDNDWVLESIKTQDIDHFKQGVVIVWKKNIGDKTIIRSYSYDLRSVLYNTHEQRLLRDSLQCQGFIHYKGDEVDYFNLVYIDRSTLKKSLDSEGAIDYKVTYYEYEIYKSGKIACIYRARWINHYEDLFLEKHKGKVSLVNGEDCLNLVTSQKKSN